MDKNITTPHLLQKVQFSGGIVKKTSIVERSVTTPPQQEAYKSMLEYVKATVPKASNKTKSETTIQSTVDTSEESNRQSNKYSNNNPHTESIANGRPDTLIGFCIHLMNACSQSTE